jgi:hypothetical protein
MLSIHRCFEHYLHKRGGIELEEVFFNTRKKGARNYAAQVANSALYRSVWMSEMLEYTPGLRSKSRAPKPITKIAKDAFLSFGFDESTRPIDDFLRSYRRWKKRHNLKVNS